VGGWFDGAVNHFQEKTMVRAGRVLGTFILCCLALSALGFAKTKNATITYPSGFAVSQRVADLPIETGSAEIEEQIHEPGAGPLRSKAAAEMSGPQEDPLVQKHAQPLVSATPGVSFSGIGSPGYVPSDSNLAVGPNDIVEVVNVQFAIYNKSGATLAGPTNILNLFTPLGGQCTDTFGDPVVLYDRPADRWVISIIGSPNGSDASECVAVSETNDPTGSYFLYGYAFGANLNDYPKLSTWATATNSAYLATYNIFENFSSFIGADLCGFDRTKMQAGDPTAAMLCQMTPSNEFGYLPGDMDGPTPPVDGTPGLFITWQNNNPGELYLRKLTLNFASGTATLGSPTTISVANSTLACGNGGQCVPQAGTTQTLDTLGDRLMYRFAIRHFSDHDRAVVNHAVGSGTSVALRWYELYDPAGSVTVNQQGTFAPDSTYRWMGSLAEDQEANIGLGYSASSSSIHPAIRFTGRMPSDPLGTMETEDTIVQGAGSQVGSYAYRWGDYTAMQVDPSDDCTFWYVDQYQAVTGTFDWSTNISSFVFSTCTPNPTFTLSANPSSLSIVQGAQATSTITINPLNGFGGSVTLSASNLPSGVTAAFNPNPTTTTSTMTLTAAANATLGTSTITIMGTSGSLTPTTSMNVTVTASGPVVTLNPTSLTWGNTVVGATSAAKTLTLTNSGASTLNISSVTASGDFAITQTAKSCGGAVAVGKSCVIKVTFTPTQLGTRTGTVTINDNAQNSPQTVALSGTGSAQATLTPVKATFAKETVGTSSPAKVFTLANKQSVPLTSISIGTTGDFSVSSTTCSSSLGAKSKCTISVVFTPTQTGTRTGTLQVSDGAIGAPQSSSLTGTGK
jgi:Protein of unknown function (DUF1573)/Abnormal spindle-like microcephaly-assoc'd, ASPM-SPD-2-Hydin